MKKMIFIISIVISIIPVYAIGNDYVVVVDKAKLREKPLIDSKYKIQLQVTYEFQSKLFKFSNENGKKLKWIFTETEFVDNYGKKYCGWLLNEEIASIDIFYNKNISKVATNINKCKIEFWFEALECDLIYNFEKTGSFTLHYVANGKDTFKIRQGHLYYYKSVFFARLESEIGLPGGLFFYKKNNMLCINDFYMVGANEVCTDCFK